MTRQEFITGVNDFYGLKGFAIMDNLDIEILDQGEFECRVEDDIRDWLTANWWYRDDFLDLLNECREMQGAEWYVRNGLLEYTDITEDFDYYKRKVLEMADECGVFDNEFDNSDEPETDYVPPAVEAAQVRFDEPAMTDAELMRLFTDAVSGAVSAP